MFHPHFIYNAATEKVQRFENETAVRGAIRRTESTGRVTGRRPFQLIHALVLGSL